MAKASKQEIIAKIETEKKTQPRNHYKIYTHIAFSLQISVGGSKEISKQIIKFLRNEETTLQPKAIG